jgi:hypothetical protein
MMAIDGILQDFFSKCARQQTAVIAIFGQPDLLNPAKVSLGVGTNQSPEVANGLIRALLQPTPATFEAVGKLLLSEKRIEDCTEEEKAELQNAVAAILQQILPTLSLRGLRQEDQRVVKSASHLISL